MDIIKIIIAGIAALCLTALTGPIMIPALRKLKFGQSILEEGPAWHKSKQGTPTMGGIMFIIGIVVAFAAAGFTYYVSGDVKAPAALILAAVYGLIGFADDYIKVKKKRNLGLTAMQKIILQTVAAAGFILFLSLKGQLSTSILIPFTDIVLELGAAYYVLAMLVLVGMVNAVNLTDGIDGLASSVTVPVALFYALAAYRLGAYGISALSVTLLGGMLGFLIFNFHPAKVFMGDTGSLFIGGMVCSLGFVLNMPFVILLAGLVYLGEAVSVMLQVCYFKISHGKRIFKMTPIHHHFELSGWNEVKIVYVFTIVSLICSIAAYIATGSVYLK